MAPATTRIARETEQVVPGTPERGEKLFADKGCAACHPVGAGKGGTAPRLATHAHRVGASEFAGLMWNHGRYMETKARRQSTTLPLLTGQELADISTYLAALGSGPPKRK